MRAVVISCVFPPEPVTSASTSYSIAQKLLERGYGVTVVAPYPSRPTGRVFSGFRRRLLQRTREGGGIDVIRCFATTSRSASLISRLFENVSFGVIGGLVLALLRRPDVIYANTWPILASGIVALVAVCRRIPFVVSVQDVYPESLLSLRRLRKQRLLSRLLRYIDVHIARRASGVVVISRRAEHIYSADRRVPTERLHFISNWKEREELPATNIVRQRREGWDISQESFLFLFAGNVAAACGLEMVIEAFARVPAERWTSLVVAGSGSTLAACRTTAQRHESLSIVFSGPFAASETMEILSAADVLVLPTQGDQSLVSVPSKLMSYMLAARPILAVARTESDLAFIIKESRCGWVIDTERPDELAAQMARIASMERSQLTTMGLRGRRYALEHFSTDACLPKLIGVLETAMRGSPG